MTAREEKQFMIKKWYFYTSLTVITVFLSSGFRPFNLETNPWFLISEQDGTHYLYPSQEVEEYTNLSIPFTGNFFVGFRERFVVISIFFHGILKEFDLSL